MSLVELARYSDAALAHIVKGKLEAAGIPVFCFDTGMNVVESVPMLFQVRVMVLDDDLDTARSLLAEKVDIEEAEGEPEGPRPGRIWRKLGHLLRLLAP